MSTKFVETEYSSQMGLNLLVDFLKNTVKKYFRSFELPYSITQKNDLSQVIPKTSPPALS